MSTKTTSTTQQPARIRYTTEENQALKEAVTKMIANKYSWKKDLDVLKQYYEECLSTKHPSTDWPKREGTALKSHWEVLRSRGADNLRWSEEEIERLKELYVTCGGKFFAIANKLGTGRSAAAIKEKWNQIMDASLLEPEEAPVTKKTPKLIIKSFPKKVEPEEDEDDKITERLNAIEDKIGEIREDVITLQQDVSDIKDTISDVKEWVGQILDYIQGSIEVQQPEE